MFKQPQRHGVNHVSHAGTMSIFIRIQTYQRHSLGRTSIKTCHSSLQGDGLLTLNGVCHFLNGVALQRQEMKGGCRQVKKKGGEQEGGAQTHSGAPFSTCEPPTMIINDSSASICGDSCLSLPSVYRGLYLHQTKDKLAWKNCFRVRLQQRRAQIPPSRRTHSCPLAPV